MLDAVPRYGARFVPEFDTILEEQRRRGTLVDGPEIARFEAAFADRLGGGHAIATSSGRMAAYFIFEAFGFPPGAEVVFPALTFWVVPELARRAGLRVVFADVDPATFTLDPAALERALTPRTRAVVPTHVYGLPCDMDAILAIARRHGLAVVEDCAHALGAAHRGRPVGTLGDAALFSFQVLKPLNTCGGGLAYTRDTALAARIARRVAELPAPDARRVRARLRLARLERLLLRPRVFAASVYPILRASAVAGWRPDTLLWERVRPLAPLPDGYLERYSNVQAALGLAGLERLSEWTIATRSNAAALDAALAGIPGVATPPRFPDRESAYYQYAVYVPDRARVVRRCLETGLDVEHHHMDVCPDLPLFGPVGGAAVGARRTADAIQVPIHPGLDGAGIARVARRLRRGLGVESVA